MKALRIKANGLQKALARNECKLYSDLTPLVSELKSFKRKIKLRAK